MGFRSKKQRGTSLAELLAAVVFIAACSGVILGTVTSAVARSGYAKRRSMALAHAKSVMEQYKAQGRSAALTTGTTVTPASIPGFGGNVAQTVVISNYSGVSYLFRVNVKISWSDRGAGGSRADDVVLETIMRCPDGA